MNYPFSEIEPKWQEIWHTEKTFAASYLRSRPELANRPKYYVLDMFPYPSGAGLHVGHPEGYTATDIMARYQRMRGFQVLHPMGWDAFGLPAERYAQKTGVHPKNSTQANINNFRRQLQRLGFSYDWDREINTTDASYVKWTQWIFLQLFDSFYDKETDCARPIKEISTPEEILRNPEKKRVFIDSHRLAYVAEMPVNWCEKLGTVLANEEVEEWENQGYEVVQKPMRQWMLRITAYAERLLKDLELVEWPLGTIELQKNWIGRSEGTLISFFICHSEDNGSSRTEIEVFTTRPDTIYGASFLALAPEHPLVAKITDKKQWPKVQKLIAQTKRRNKRSRQAEADKASGVFLGVSAEHPLLKGKKIPIWISDFVLMDYGSGAIMSVPAHDERDFRFAKKYNLPIQQVITPAEFPATHSKNQAAEKASPPDLPFTGYGIAVASDFVTGQTSEDAKEKIIAELEKKNVGKRKVQYKIRDWIFSRQRYWGEPIPISRDENGAYVPQRDLPLPLPDPIGFDLKQGQSPLAHHTDWLFHTDSSEYLKQKKQNANKKERKLERETNTMPQWAGSCWYYLRFIDPDNEEALIDSKEENYWMGKKGVDLYVGGKEHAVLHLLYARFWHKFLYDINVVSQREPFPRLVHQGIILGEDGKKMSKSLGNVVNPDIVVDEYGADALRCYEMFLGPLEQDKRWSAKGIEGIHRFLNRTWRLFILSQEQDKKSDRKIDPALLEEPTIKNRQELLYTLHTTIRLVTKDIESMNFNTAISHLMVFVNTAHRLKKSIGRKASQAFVLLLSPFAPHIAEELWSLLGHKQSLAFAEWPTYDPKYATPPEKEIVIQVNGKIRGKETVAHSRSEKEMIEMAMNNTQVQSYLRSQRLRVVKTIVVKKKLVNLVCQKSEQIQE